MNFDLDMNLEIEDLIKNEHITNLKSNNEDNQKKYYSQEITVPDNLNDEWGKNKQNQEIVNKIEDLSKLLFSDDNEIKKEVIQSLLEKKENSNSVSFKNNNNNLDIDSTTVLTSEFKEVSNNSELQVLDKVSANEIELIEALQLNLNNGSNKDNYNKTILTIPENKDTLKGNSNDHNKASNINYIL